MIEDITRLKVGDKVCFQPAHFQSDDFENGIIKEIPDFALDPKSPHGYKCVRVVYHCNNNWDNYQNYTSALTHISSLSLGWK